MHWRQLGRRLLEDEEALTGIDNDYHKSNEKAFEMLKKWKQRNGLSANFHVLYDALCDKRVDRKDLAEEFCCSKQ